MAGVAIGPAPGKHGVAVGRGEARCEVGGVASGESGSRRAPRGRAAGGPPGGAFGGNFGKVRGSPRGPEPTAGTFGAASVNSRVGASAGVLAGRHGYTTRGGVGVARMLDGSLGGASGSGSSASNAASVSTMLAVPLREVGV
mmetsp:Transcript_102726/g.331475  ORF Transcript_102726/g.331475 Transcript_102726/m.331475 type:complete len:142 (+) Transcript_102726:1225-1650(+)